jgi:hypothetical protein
LFNAYTDIHPDIRCPFSLIYLQNMEGYKE